MLNLLNAISSMEGNYDSRKIGRDEINGLEVSTCWTTDMGYETAILDMNGAHPVERYNSKEKAESGHKKWCKKAKTIKKIMKLGYDDLVDSKEITLERDEK